VDLPSVKTTLLKPLAFARTLIRGASAMETVPLDVNVARSAPVSALITVKLVTVCAATHPGAHIEAPQTTAMQALETFTRQLLG
jgi:hypothetical protein